MRLITLLLLTVVAGCGSTRYDYPTAPKSQAYWEEFHKGYWDVERVCRRACVWTPEEGVTQDQCELDCIIHHKERRR